MHIPPWEDRLFAHPQLSAAHKLVLWALFRVSSRSRGRQDSSWMRIRLSDVATRVGLSTEMVEHLLLDLAAADVIRRTVLSAAPAQGRAVAWLFIALTDRFDAPETIRLIEPEETDQAHE